MTECGFDEEFELADVVHMRIGVVHMRIGVVHDEFTLRSSRFGSQELITKTMACICTEERMGCIYTG